MANERWYGMIPFFPNESPQCVMIRSWVMLVFKKFRNFWLYVKSLQSLVGLSCQVPLSSPTFPVQRSVFLFSNFEKSVTSSNLALNPRLTGGGRLTPPLPNIRDSSKTNSAIDVKLGRPSHTTILHRPWNFFWNPSENFWDMVDFVTSLHATFGRKLAKLRGSVEDAVFNENANGKHQKT